MVERDEDGNPTGRFDLEGAQLRLGHSVAFFIGTAYGSTATAEKLAQTVRAMHHTIKGVRPDGLPYDADDPEWLRWNYATVVWGIATAHEMYHPLPLQRHRPLLRANSSGSATHSAEPTCRPPRPTPWSACGPTCRGWR